jgi:hypothetical protein
LVRHLVEQACGVPRQPPVWGGKEEAQTRAISILMVFVS